MRRNKYRHYFWCYILSFFLGFTNAGFAQSVGIRFGGQDVVQDKRTSLDLSPGKSICFNGNFEVSFDISFPPNHRDYFGYILRIINDEGQSIDLIYDQKRTDSNNFKVIANKTFSSIAFRLDSSALYKKWNTFSLKYELANKKLIFNYNGQQLIENSVDLNNSRCLKFLFGANEFKNFKTTDVPPMNIRNVRILENKRLKYWWKLDETAGNEANDVIEDRKAVVMNPTWIKAQHSKWQLIQNISIPGNASVALNAEQEILYLVGSQSLYKFSIAQRKMDSIPYQKPRNLTTGNQSVYNHQTGKIYNISVDQKTASVFNEATGKWASDFKYPASLTVYWHHNKFISAIDSALYVIGGYGQLNYKNTVQRINLKSGVWDTITPAGDQLHPRYLAALGTDSAGTAYIIGGHGSLTGQQMLGPQNYYDLLIYDVKTSRFRKVYEFSNIEDDFAFANSLIVNHNEGAFYGLIFQNNKFNSNLQLMKGSLNRPVYELVGNSIPYEFHDIESFADLFYCPQSKKLIAATLFRNGDNTTSVKIYSIDFPPAKLDQKPVAKSDNSLLSWILLSGLIVLIPIAIYYLRKKRVHAPNLTEPLAEKEFKTVVADQPALIIEDAIPDSCTSAVLLFGNLQVFDTEGNNITRMFTPLLKELLLIILIYTIRWERGVSSEKLNELLWQDKSEKDARNNRSVNIAKLRAILEKVGTSGLSKDTGYWKLDLSTNKLFVDYQQYTIIVKRKDKLEKQSILELITIINRGSFLANVEYQWLDDLKSEVSNEIINILLHYAKLSGIEQDPEFIILLMNYVFYFDLVNEDAMILKCRALVYLGKHTLASNTLEKFKKEYKVLYGEDYERSFNEILET
jgi:two-component SAPR family response regulator